MLRRTSNSFAHIAKMFCEIDLRAAAEMEMTDIEFGGERSQKPF